MHAWAEGRDKKRTTLFLESACSIPIGNVDVGRLEALQPWADVVAQLHEKLTTESNTSSDAPTPSVTNDKGKPQHKLDVRKLMRDAAPAWLWALPFVGEGAHADSIPTPANC